MASTDRSNPVSCNSNKYEVTLTQMGWNQAGAEMNPISYNLGLNNSKQNGFHHLATLGDMVPHGTLSKNRHYLLTCLDLFPRAL